MRDTIASADTTGRRRRGRRARCEQRTFERLRWGGARPGAGRKRDPRSGVPHATRPALAARFPVHVTLKLRPGLPSLRSRGPYAVWLRSLWLGGEKPGFRVVHYAVLSNHLHLVVEAADRQRLTLGMQGLAIRVAKRLNRWWGRKGSVFADRYHARILRTPREVRNALCYVLCNARRHGLRLDASRPDPFSSGEAFDGWRERSAGSARARGVVAQARTWLVRVGWRRHGLLRFAEVPRGA